MNRHYHHELEIVPFEQPQHIAPSTCKRPRPAPRSHRAAWFALAGAVLGFAVHLATVPAPVIVESWGANLVHAVGEDRWLVLEDGLVIGECSHAGPRTLAGSAHAARDVVREGAHFASTRADIDITWANDCPR